MNDDTDELSGWRLRVRELNAEAEAARTPPPRRLREHVVELVVLAAMVAVVCGVAVWWGGSDGGAPPDPAPTSSSATPDAGLDPDVVDAAQACVAAGEGSAEDCTVGAVIANGGG
jgi:hypothetical protein